MCISYNFQAFGQIKWPLLVKHKLNSTGTFLGNDSYLPGLTAWWTFSAHASLSIPPSVHPYLQGPLRKETKDREDSCFKRRISTFFIWREDTSLIISLWQPQITAGSPAQHPPSTRMNEQTQASLSFYKVLHLLPPSHSFYIYLLYSADIKVPNMTWSFKSRSEVGLTLVGFVQVFYFGWEVGLQQVMVRVNVSHVVERV